MAIEIYEINKEAKKLDLKLYAVAPFEKLYEIQLKISKLNKEAEEAGNPRRFTYDVTAVEIWK